MPNRLPSAPWISGFWTFTSDFEIEAVAVLSTARAGWLALAEPGQAGSVRDGAGLAAPDPLAGFRLDRVRRQLERAMLGTVLDRSADRSRVAAVDVVGRLVHGRLIGRRLVDIVRTVMVAAGKGAARGNEKGRGCKSNLGHLRYSRFSKACPSSGVP
ncbi:hypothetical protein MPLB_1770010 [Mesorhizobium sp. ORS 3324]|nr:hypothetical protein MPLB_1770010 [Mesorhizobium sp. ORS 3324]